MYTFINLEARSWTLPRGVSLPPFGELDVTADVADSLLGLPVIQNMIDSGIIKHRHEPTVEVAEPSLDVEHAKTLSKSDLDDYAATFGIKLDARKTKAAMLKVLTSKVD